MLLDWADGQALRSSSGPPSTGLKLWLKADAGVSKTGSSVTAWADQSGNGNHVTQGTGANQPTFLASGINGLPAINFAPTQYLTRANSPLASGSGPRTAVIVMQTADLFGGCMMCLGKDGAWWGPSFQALTTSGTVLLLTPAGFTTNTTTDCNPYAAVPLVVVISTAGAGSPITYSVNGTPLTVVGGNTGTDSADFLSVGDYQNSGPGAVPWKGKMPELFLYDHVLVSGELATMGSYVHGRFGL